MKWKDFRKKFIDYKIFYQRSLGYISLVNSAMILFILLSDLKKYGVFIDIKTWFFPILIGGIFLLILFGYLEDKLGFFRTEQEEATKRTPQMNAILEKLNHIENDVKDIRKNLK
jgi:hypothetical protein